MSNFKIAGYEEILMFLKCRKALLENRFAFQELSGFSIRAVESELYSVSCMIESLETGGLFYMNDKRTDEDFLNNIVKKRDEQTKAILQQYYDGKLEHTDYAQRKPNDPT